MKRTALSAFLGCCCLLVVLPVSSFLAGPSPVAGLHQEPTVTFFEASQDTPSLDPQSPQGVTWHIQRVDAPKAFSNMRDRSLRLDAAGRPHIAYGLDHLYYAWHDGSHWHQETVDPAWGVGMYASLALD
ncbi:MAG: BNR repeat-containing protein, partial [Caldilineales bacterium]|nr:BNR repeat-containing protein [Caldilineales bacterium]